MAFLKDIPQNEKTAFIKTVANVAHLNEINQKKIDFVKDLYEYYQINEISFDEVIAKSEEEDIFNKVKEITSLKLKRILVREMFFIAYSDGELAEDELDFIIKIATTMGISETIVLAIGDWVVRSIELDGEGDALFSKDA